MADTSSESPVVAGGLPLDFSRRRRAVQHMAEAEADLDPATAPTAGGIVSLFSRRRRAAQRMAADDALLVDPLIPFSAGWKSTSRRLGPDPSFSIGTRLIG